MDCKFKENAIDSAVDYVLKYALNDFDIENFKSSNHLSMKQIRKDIMKKNNSVSSLSKLNNSLSMNNAVNTSATLSSKCSTLTQKSYDASFYKHALNTAIDEFGLFVQENFIVINEFQAAKPQVLIAKISSSTTPECPGATEEKADEEARIKQTTETDDAEALKLKEALEVARHNFYKGKLSMVCLTKTGGYVVKEVKDQVPAEHEDTGAVLCGNFEKAEKIEENAPLVSDQVNEADEAVKQQASVAEHVPQALDQGESMSDAAQSQSPEKVIDIKKEIAFSILNVGEVLAKTIDYYSLDPNTDDIKNLVEISNKQKEVSSKLENLNLKEESAEDAASSVEDMPVVLNEQIDTLTTVEKVATEQVQPSVQQTVGDLVNTEAEKEPEVAKQQEEIIEEASEKEELLNEFEIKTDQANDAPKSRSVSNISISSVSANVIDTPADVPNEQQQVDEQCEEAAKVEEEEEKEKEEEEEEGQERRRG